MARNLLIISGIIVVSLVGIFFYNQIQYQQYQDFRQETQDNEEYTKAKIRNDITSYITADRSQYSYSELGGITNLKISVTNATDYVIDNVRVRVIYIKANGEVWNSKIIDFNLLTPQSKSTIEMPDTERGTRVEYEIVSIKSNELNLY